MDIRVFQEFLAVVRHQNITHAANKLHISQSVLSRHIAGLEKELGRKLFSRYRPLRLTPAGKIVLQHACEIHDSYAEIQSGLKALKDTTGGKLLIHDMTFYPPGMNSYVAAQRKMKVDYPSVDVQQINTIIISRIEDLLAGKVDVTFILRDESDVPATEINGIRVDYVRIGNIQDRLCLGVGKNNHLANKASVRIVDLAAERFVRPVTMQLDEAYVAFITHCQEKNFEPKFEHISCSLKNFWMLDFSRAIIPLTHSCLEFNAIPTYALQQLEIRELSDLEDNCCMFAVFREDAASPALDAFLEALSTT
jgi:DNA-binding transcriptional LysR family regulator